MTFCECSFFLPQVEVILLKKACMVPPQETVFKIRSETCRTEAQFCQNLYIFIYDKEGKLAGPTQILPVNIRGPALILKTEEIFNSNFKVLCVGVRCQYFCG